MASTRRFLYEATRVFWDVEDFPVPPGCNLWDFESKVRSALRKEGYTGDLDIWAYGGVKSSQEEDLFRMSNINLQEQEDKKVDRLYRMLMDMAFWAHSKLEFLGEEKNFVVIAQDIPEGDTEFYHVLGELKRRGFYVFFVGHYENYVIGPDDPAADVAKLVWNWEDLYYGDYAFAPYSDLEDGSSDDFSQNN